MVSLFERFRLSWFGEHNPFDLHIPVQWDIVTSTGFSFSVKLVVGVNISDERNIPPRLFPEGRIDRPLGLSGAVEAPGSAWTSFPARLLITLI